MTDVASDLQDQGLQALLTIDRDTAGRLGVTPAAIDNVLYNAFGQRLISTIFTQANQYRVVLEVKPEFRSGPEALRELYVPGTDFERRHDAGAVERGNAVDRKAIAAFDQSLRASFRRRRFLSISRPGIRWATPSRRSRLRSRRSACR